MRDATDITFLLDRSGSMAAVVDDTIGGFNTFLDKQRSVPGECRVTLIQFDSQDAQEVLYAAKSLVEVEGLTKEQFIPRGATPLCDALGIAITNTGARLAALPESERPSRVIFVVLTDGQENASREYNSARVRKMVEHQRDAYNWQVVFLGADQDAITAGERLGVSRDHALSYQNSSHGNQVAYAASASLVANMRQAAPQALGSVTFTDADRQAAVE